MENNRENMPSKSETAIKQLNEEKRFYQHIALNPSVKCILINSKEQIEFISQSLSKICGYQSANAFLEQIFNKLNLLFCSNRTISLINNFLKGDVPLKEIKSKLRHKNGSSIDIILKPRKYSFSTGYCLVCNVDLEQTKKDISLDFSAEEQQYQDIIQNLIEGFYISTIDGRLIYYNKQFVKILGLDPKVNYKGIELPDFWQEKDDRKLYIQQLQAKGYIKNYMVNAKNFNGDQIILRANSRLIKDCNGDILRIEGTFLEVTELKLAEKDLKNNERRLDVLLSNLPGMAYKCLSDNNWSMIYVNEACINLTGYTQAQIVNNKDVSYNDIICEEDRVNVRNIVNKGIEEKKHFELEYRIVTAAGKLKWVWEKGILTQDNETGEYFLEGLIQDISDRKLAENRLRISRERYQSLFENSPVPLWEEDFKELYIYLEELKAKGIKDIRNYLTETPEELLRCSEKIKVLNVNKAALELHKAKDKNELLGNLKKVFTEKSYRDFKEEIIAIYEGLKEFSIEGEVKTIDGEIKQVLLNLKVEEERGGDFTALLSTIDITELKKAETNLLYAKNFTENLIKTANAIVVVLNEKGNIRIFNESAEKLTGYTFNELREQNWFDILVPADIYPDAWHTFKELKTGKFPKENETAILTKGGEERIISWQNNEILEDGRIVGVISFGIDITERLSGQKALVASEYKLKKAEKIASLGHWEYSFNRDVITWSEVIYDILEINISKKEASLIEFLDMIHPDDTELFNNCYKISVKDKKPIVVEFRVVTKKEKVKFIRLQYYIVFDKLENPIQSSGIIQDITTYKKAEENLRLRSVVLTNMDEGVYLIRSIDGIIVYSNPAFERMFGYKPKELIGKHVSIVNAPSEISKEEKAKRIIDKLNKSGKWEGEILNIKKDNTTFWSHVKVSSFTHHEFGKVWIAVHANITRRKDAEEELQNYRNHLEDIVNKRTTELEKKNTELQRFFNATINREFRIKELRDQVSKLKTKLNSYIKK